MKKSPAPIGRSAPVAACRVAVQLMVAAVFLYLVNNYLVFWLGLPGPYETLAYYGIVDSGQQQSGQNIVIGWIQIAAYALVLAGAGWWQYTRLDRFSALDDSEILIALVAFIIKVAFWAVFLIGLIDAFISLLRTENWLGSVVGSDLSNALVRPSFRGAWVHLVLIFCAFGCAVFFRRVNFIWLTLLVVLAEFVIVITRFIFSYEQPFMGDLVRFWYAALFLFASAYTLLHDGHVRVDLLYAGMSPTRKAISNLIGIVLLGIPLCWVILMQGMGGRGDSINAPLLSIEISQSGYGLYVKYLMAGFLVVFAVTMMIQFLASLLNAVDQIQNPGKS